MEQCTSDVGMVMAGVVARIFCNGVEYIRSAEEGARAERLTLNSNDKRAAPAGPINHIIRAVLGASSLATELECYGLCMQACVLAHCKCTSTCTRLLDQPSSGATAV